MGDRAAPSVGRLVDHLFRRSYGRLVARLTRVFGAGEIELAEDVVQEALLRALRVWPYQGVPERPEAWLVRVARNRALDVIRRREMAARVEEEVRSWAGGDEEETPEEVADDGLRMIFTCCHPVLSFEARVALTLKTLCGFGVVEIARAFLDKEATVAQRLARARVRLREEGVGFDVPGESERVARLEGVLTVVYLMFNEGYGAAQGEELVRVELVEEAVRLGRLLVDHPATARPEVHALLALMLLQGARLPARTDEDGEVLTMREQDRRAWDQRWIAAGMAHFERSVAGERLTRWHVEAAIASVHAMAGSYEETDWGLILRRYGELMEVAPSPVVALNRAVAVAKVEGVGAGLLELDALEGDARLRDYCLLPAARGMFLWAEGRMAAAAECFRRALGMRCSGPQRAFLERRLRRCEQDEPCAGF